MDPFCWMWEEASLIMSPPNATTAVCIVLYTITLQHQSSKQEHLNVSFETKLLYLNKGEVMTRSIFWSSSEERTWLRKSRTCWQPRGESCESKREEDIKKSWFFRDSTLWTPSACLTQWMILQQPGGDSMLLHRTQRNRFEAAADLKKYITNKCQRARNRDTKFQLYCWRRERRRSEIPWEEKKRLTWEGRSRRATN